MNGAFAFRLGRLCSHLWVLSWQALPATRLHDESDRSFSPCQCSDFPLYEALRVVERLSGTAVYNIH